MFPRSRIVYGSLTAGVMLAGFLSRRLLGHHTFIRLYVGDVLWALMVFLDFAFIFRQWPAWKVATAALAFSTFIEFSQLYHAAWIENIREMPLGGLILGFTFVWSDLICYCLGVGFGTIADILLGAYNKKGPENQGLHVWEGDGSRTLPLIGS